MNQQDKHDQRALDMYKNKVRNNTLTIEKSIYDIVQNIQFVDQLPINVLKVYYSYDIRFDRVPSKITNLQFTNSPQTNFTGLEQMKQLMILSLNDNQLSQINFISSLINLTNLNVCSNIIKDLSPLQNLIQLKEINLNFNKIQDISPLKKLVKLEIIHLNSNQVIDVHPLKYLKELTQLYIRQNKIITIKPLHSLTKLAICDLNYNFIQDISNMPLISSLEEEDEEMGFGLFDESEEEIDQQGKPTKQQLLLSNKITAVYEQQDKFQKEAKNTITTKQGFAQMCNKIQQILSNSNESHLRWSQCIAQLFQMTDSAISQ
ncbi:leucine-rich_repeat domain-containing protein [Hexamita inflata]|uniref:Leucine-rich_repeat domain-containing protein n=1 Tax=Hexamita inflata TaxID=28002 RepID=A0ABP1HBC5_9EUKA